MRKFRTQIRNREALAIDQRADVMLLEMSPIRPNEMHGAACVMWISGPLEHRVCPYGDSYESIRQRFGEALASDAECILIRMDSPGGVVSGLNQAVYDMTRAKVANKKPVYVYVDELTCSAAYALACVADEIIIPPSGVAGSIGVISALVDQVAADKAMGLNFVTITSGARKADGHAHVPVSEEAVAEEQRRVAQLAAQFYDIVSRARGLSVARVKGYEAGVFLGKEAVRVGLADQVAGWEELLAQIQVAHGGNQVAHSGTAASNTKRPSMLLQLKNLIAKTKAALAAETRASKRAALAMQLANFEATYKAMKKTKYKLEEETTEEDDMPCDEPDKDDDKAESEESDEEAESEESEEEASAEGDDEEASAEDDDKDVDAEDDEPKKDARKGAKKAKATHSPGALAALKEAAARTAKAEARIATLERERATERKLARIEAKLKGGFIYPSEAKALRANKDTRFVNDYLDMRTEKLVNTEAEAPRPAVKESPLSAREQELQREALRAVGLDPDKVKPAPLANGGPPTGAAVLQLTDLAKMGA